MINFTSKEDGSLTKILLKNYPQLTFGEVKVLLRKKDIKINGKRVNGDVEISYGDEIVVYNKDKQLNVVYEDNNILVVHKPFGVETTKADKTYKGESLEEMTNAFACHRLDMNTEGLVVLAKNEFVLREMFKEFKEGNINKFYLARVKGVLKDKEKTLTHYLVKGDGQVKVYGEKVKDSVNIITKYKVLEEFEDESLLEVELITGKTHQIRAHLSFIGHPVIGDNKYGDKEFNKTKGNKKQCLCSYKITFNLQSGVLKYLNALEFKTKPTFSK